MQAITRFFVDRWQFTLVAFLLLLGLGVVSLRDIAKSEDPIARFPGSTVVVVLPGADAEQMERLVAIPMESALNALEDVAEIRSSSRAGVSVIRVEFVYGSDPEKKHDEVVREANALRPELPEGVTRVRVNRSNPAEAAVLQVALVSETAPVRQMEAYARELADALERASGVQQAEIWGAPASEVRVAVDLDVLAARQMPLTAVADALRREGADIPVGAVEAGGRRLNVEATGAFDSLDEIRAVTLRSGDGATLRVGDVAAVSWENDENLHITRFNGERALFVSVRAKLGEDVFRVRDGLKARLDAFAPRLPSAIRLERGFDQSETVAARMGQLARDFAIALGLVLLTLLPLGLRASLVVMVAVPASFAAGMIALHVLGYTLNQLSIAGFVLSLGLLVDDSIVVTENISRRLREGLSRRDAAIAGVQEIGVAVIGCTATLLLAFLPIMALPEASGDFIRSLPVTVIVTVAASLVVSLTLIPFLAAWLLPVHAEANPVLDRVMAGVHLVYRPALRLALSRPRATVAAGLALFGLSLGLVPKLGFSLFPENDSPYFVVDIELPRGASLAETDAAVRFADGVLSATPGIGWRFANSGRGNPQVYYNDIPEEQQSHVGQIYARFAEAKVHAPAEILGGVSRRLEGYPGATFNVRRFQQGPPVEAPIAVRISGPDLNVLSALAADVATAAESTPGARNVVNPLSGRLIGVDLGLDTEAAGLRGVPAGALDQTLRIAISGAEVARYRDPVGEGYPVVVRAPRDGAFSVEGLSRLHVWTETGAAAPLEEFARPRLSSGPASIDRFQRERTVTVRAWTQDGFLTSRVTADLSARLASIVPPPGYTLSFGGEVEQQSESFGGLLPAILIASLGVLAVLLLEFGSFAVSAVVAFVIPFGVMGGLIALWIGGQSLSFTAIIGFIALIGIEIKNSILLVDLANQLRRDGVPLREAVERAGEVRFLPVLLTALTAIGGLAPLVIEFSPLYSPLAMVIMGGLASSTLLARIVTPPLYLLLASRETRHSGEAPPAAAPVAQDAAGVS